MDLQFRIELETAVDAGHYEVEFRQHLIRIIERAVGENVGLDPFEDTNPAAGFVELVDARCCSLISSTDRPPA